MIRNKRSRYPNPPNAGKINMDNNHRQIKIITIVCSIPGRYLTTNPKKSSRRSVCSVNALPKITNKVVLRNGR
jgi:hypothetical protein